MICEDCQRAGAHNAAARDLRGELESSPHDRELAVTLHRKCIKRYGQRSTHCDCQHGVGDGWINKKLVEANASVPVLGRATPPFASPVTVEWSQDGQEVPRGSFPG